MPVLHSFGEGGSCFPVVRNPWSVARWSGGQSLTVNGRPARLSWSARHIMASKVRFLGRPGTSHGTAAICKIPNVYRPWDDGTAPAHYATPPAIFIRPFLLPFRHQASLSHLLGRGAVNTSVACSPASSHLPPWSLVCIFHLPSPVPVVSGQWSVVSSLPPVNCHDVTACHGSCHGSDLIKPLILLTCHDVTACTPQATPLPRLCTFAQDPLALTGLRINRSIAPIGTYWNLLALVRT